MGVVGGRGRGCWVGVGGRGKVWIRYPDWGSGLDWVWIVGYVI